MGCSNSKETAISELKSMISQIASENEKLQQECEKLKNQNEKKPAEENANLQDIQTVQKQFEKDLKSLTALTSQFYESSKQTTALSNPKLKELLEIESKLTRKSEKIKKMINERDHLRVDQEGLENQIHESEEQIKELEKIAFPDSEAIKTHSSFNKKVIEIEFKNQDLLEEIHKTEEEIQKAEEEIQKTEECLSTIAEETKNSVFDDKISGSDPSNYDILISLNDSDIMNELRKVDAELEELSEQISVLKTKESELINLETYSNSRYQNRGGFKKNESLKQQIKNSQDRVDMLESEKNKVKEEINRLKRKSFGEEGINEKLNALNSIIEKKKNKDEETGKVISENLVNDIEETLKKARMLTMDLKGAM